MLTILWIFVAVIGLLALSMTAAYLLQPRHKQSVIHRLAEIRRRFHLQREMLEAKFIELAYAHAKPDAPRWSDCSFADDVAYVRDRVTGELSAFVAVTIATEESAGLHHGAADDLQEGTAVFRFDRDHWVTDGRTILNLSPIEAIHFYGDDVEIVGEEIAQPF